MNLDRYEKIDGREALKRLIDGEHVFMELINETAKLKLLEDGLRCDIAGHDNQVTYWTFNQVYMSKGLYIPKPFDVRKAMLDRPYEWVAAYPNHEGKWFKIGFVSASMSAVVEELEWEGPPFWQHVRARPHLLDNCIPIEDVPEEATR